MVERADATILDFHKVKIRKEIKLIGPEASSRKLATGLHVLRPSGATKPRGKSALVVLRQAIELEETFTPYRSKGFPKRREWCEACLDGSEPSSHVTGPEAFPFLGERKMTSTPGYMHVHDPVPLRS